MITSRPLSVIVRGNTAIASYEHELGQAIQRRWTQASSDKPCMVESREFGTATWVAEGWVPADAAAAAAVDFRPTPRTGAAAALIGVAG